MCGLAGFWAVDGDRREFAQVASRMTDSIRHRGPDDSGTWHNDGAGLVLAHRRLSILDLSAAGHQPMHSACGRYVTVFNGEIYNHGTLRSRLGAEGHAPDWRGHADTETLLAGFAAWGVERTLEATVGMFAFALWDRRERVLTLARDRMGEKPLYYGWQGGTFLFGSELKALRAHPRFEARVDRSALSLLLRYNCIPDPHSIFEGIFKLRPGHLLQIAMEHVVARETPAPRAWWRLGEVIRRSSASPLLGDEKAAVDELERVLAQGVRDQMLSDVPLGAFLSGGVDSSTIVALMQSASSTPVKTFTIGFDEAGYDEAAYANAIARHLGTEHHEVYVQPRDALNVIPRLPTLYCEPFADSSQIPTFLVSELARQHVTVALSGDGGDELFGGYNRYLAARVVWRRLNRLPPAVRRAVAGALRGVPPRGWDCLFGLASRWLPTRLRVANAGEKAHKLAGVLCLTDGEAFYRQLRSHWEDPGSVVIGGAETADSPMDAGGLSAGDCLEQWMMAQDAQTYLPDDILVKVDRAAMANSLETRVPLLDHRVVELAWRLPLKCKIRGEEGKWALRQVLYRHIPTATIERPKMGFAIPLNEWLRGPLREWAEDLLDAARLRREGYLEPEPIRRIWDLHLSGKSSEQYRLWDVLMFQAWLAAQ
jgi:asparagine synthase (glutamine-hydrolysing)